MTDHYYMVHVAVGYDRVRAPESVGIWPIRPRCGGTFNSGKDIWFRSNILEAVAHKAVTPCPGCFTDDGLELYLLAAV